MTTKAVTYHPDEEIAYLSAKNGVMLGGAGDGRPAIDTDAKMAEAILALSATTNGRLAVQGFRELERRTGTRLVDLAEGSEEKRITFADTQARPVPVITSPEWSGSETGGRRYAPFTVNVERRKPWHTLTGRMHFLLDHDWMHEMGETLPIFRVPLDMRGCSASRRPGDLGRGRRLGDRALPDPTLQVVDPLGVPGQPVHALALAWRPGRVDEPGRRRRRSACATTTGSRRSTATACWCCGPIVTHRMPRGHRVRLPRPGAGGERAEVRGHRAPRRHPQLADPDPGQADAPDRRLRPAVLRVQLPRSDRQPARRGHGRSGVAQSQKVEY